MNNDGLRELERLVNEHKRKKYPSVPASALPKTKYSDKSTNDLQTALIDYIDAIGGWATRVNTTGLWVQALGRHIPSSTKKGTPDIIGCLPGGRFIGIECKQPSEKLREEQEEVKQDIEHAEGLHLVGYVGHFQKVYDRINGIIKQQTITV